MGRRAGRIARGGGARHRRGHRRDRRGVAGIVVQTKRRGRHHQRPTVQDVDVQREKRRRPGRPGEPEEEQHPVAQDHRGARHVGTQVLHGRLPSQPPRRTRGQDRRDGRQRMVHDPVGAEATRSLRAGLRRRHAEP